MTRDKLRDIRSKLSKKSMTDLGKKRKIRNVEKLFHTDLTTFLYLSFYQEALSILKAYVMAFQISEVMVQLLHERQLETFLKFLACFVKAEYVAKRVVKSIKNLILAKIMVSSWTLMTCL